MYATPDRSGRPSSSSPNRPRWRHRETSRRRQAPECRCARWFAARIVGEPYGCQHRTVHGCAASLPRTWRMPRVDVGATRVRIRDRSSREWAKMGSKNFAACAPIGPLQVDERSVVRHGASPDSDDRCRLAPSAKPTCGATQRRHRTRMPGSVAARKGDIAAPDAVTMQKPDSPERADSAVPQCSSGRAPLAAGIHSWRKCTDENPKDCSIRNGYRRPLGVPCARSDIRDAGGRRDPSLRHLRQQGRCALRGLPELREPRQREDRRPDRGSGLRFRHASPVQQGIRLGAGRRLRHQPGDSTRSGSRATA